MKFFTRKELFAVILIFSAIILASLSNFKVSLRRARDVQRKNDIRTVADFLALYTSDFSAFPLSDQGRIVACEGPETKVDQKGRITGLVACEWGKDPLPRDPYFEKGFGYIYLSNANRFQLYASLEGADEPEYDQRIVARNLSCGSYICNFGIGYGETPLDKSIEEYENELLRLK